MNAFSLSTVYTLFPTPFDLREKNKEKLEEIKQLYHKAKNFPRKQKKAVRKKCIVDYNFWLSLDKWYDDFMNGNLTY